MLKLRRFIERVLSFSSDQLWALVLLGIGAGLQGANTVFFDSLASGLYIGTYGTFDLSFNFILAAVALCFFGWVALKIEHAFGRGTGLFLWLAILCQGVLFAAFYHGYQLSIDALFVLKWGYRLALFSAFWALAFRFVELSMKSKRFLFLVVCEFFGYLSGALFTYLILPVLGIKLFWLGAVFSTFVLWFVLRSVARFAPQMPQVKAKKNGGVSEQSQIALLYLIYIVAFLMTAIQSLIDYTLCLEAVELYGLFPITQVKFFATVWALYAGAALFLLACLYTLRRAFHIATAIIIAAFLPLVCYLGWAAQILWIVLFAKVVFEIISYFCVGYYLRLLPRPLSYGNRSRLKLARRMVAEPAGFALVALVFYFSSYDAAALLLSCLISLTLLFALIDCQNEYAKVLLSAFKTFRWRGGRLMISNEKVMEYIDKKAASRNPDEAIYFLRVLEDAQVSNLKNKLRHALSHESPRVRAFALSAIERNNFRMFKKTLSDLIDKDKNPKIRQKALDVFCALGEKYAVEKAVLYLDDEVLRKGALIGLIKSGGEGVVIASEDLNKMASSRRPEQRLQVAEILQQAGRKGFFRLAQHLIQDENVEVQKAALLAAGKIKHNALLDLIFKALNDMRLREEALAALKMYGTAAYASIAQAIGSDRQTELCQKTLITHLWIEEDLTSKQILLGTLKNMSLKLRVYTLHFLKMHPVVQSQKNRQKIFLPLIEMDFKQALTTLLLLKDFQVAPTSDTQNSFEMLTESLKTDFEYIRHSLLLEVAFMWPSTLMRTAVDVLLDSASGEPERRAAEGTIEDLLPRTYAKLNAILRALSFDERLKNTPSRALSKGQTMDEQFAFILASKSYRSAWTKAITLTCVRRLDVIMLKDAIVDLLQDKSPLVRENALWALDRLVESVKEKKKILNVCLHDENKTIRQMAESLLK